jgi:hypothetical protein
VSEFASPAPENVVQSIDGSTQTPPSQANEQQSTGD